MNSYKIVFNDNREPVFYSNIKGFTFINGVTYITFTDDSKDKSLVNVAGIVPFM
jgi:hypothetical protein